MSVTRGGDDRPHELSIWRNCEDKGVHVSFERPDYDHKLIKPDANPNAPTPIHPGRRVGGGIGLDENQVRALYKTLHEHLGEPPAEAGTITVKVNVDDADALDKLTALRREIEKALDALPAFLQGPPTITVTDRDPAFDNVPGDEADEESLLDEVLAEARERVGLDPDDEEYGLPVMSRDDAEKLDRLIQNPLGALADALEEAGLDIPVVNGRSLELLKRLLVREHEAEKAEQEEPQGPPEAFSLPYKRFGHDTLVRVEAALAFDRGVFIQADGHQLTPDEAKQVRDAIDAFVRWAER